MRVKADTSREAGVFSVSDWQKSDTKAPGKHVSFGVKSFISKGTSTTLQQMIYPAGNTSSKKRDITMFPNPTQNEVYSPVFVGKDIRIFQINGALVKTVKSVSERFPLQIFQTEPI